MTRRSFLQSTFAGSLAAFSPALLNAKQRETFSFYIGTYTTGGKSEGIYRASCDGKTGKLQVLSAYPTLDPSYLTLDRKNRFLYAVNETMDYEGAASGAVTAFAREANGDLRKLNTVASKGGAPCYVALDQTERMVLVANYMGGNAASFAIQADGSLSAAQDLIQHSGKGPNADRQEAAHAHFIRQDPASGQVWVVDLGIDQVRAYDLDTKTGKLTAAPEATLSLKAGAGPRHMAFHPNGRWAYVINELDSTVAHFTRQSPQTPFHHHATHSTLPEGFNAPNFPADLHLSPDGRYLYGSNRGHNSLVVYRVNQQNGTLKQIQVIATEGDWPRNFAFDPTGRFILVANQRSSNIVVFKRHKKTGLLTSNQMALEVPNPVCLVFTNI